MSDKVKNLLVRTASGAVLGAVILGGILWTQSSYVLLLALLTVSGMSEFYDLAEKRGSAPQRWLGIIMGVLLLSISYNFVSPCGRDAVACSAGANWLLWAKITAVILLPFLIFICELFRAKPNPETNISTTMMGVGYVGVPAAMLCYMPAFEGFGGWNPLIVLFFILIIWANDVFAYLVGITLGRHRMLERISPQKSWEGFFGGIAGAIAMGVFAAYISEGNIWSWMGLALLAAIFGVLGDFVESMFKRSAGVKDSGNLIPGHGGVLDRFDALLLATPFVFVYVGFTSHLL